MTILSGHYTGNGRASRSFYNTEHAACILGLNVFLYKSLLVIAPLRSKHRASHSVRFEEYTIKQPCLERCIADLGIFPFRSFYFVSMHLVNDQQLQECELLWTISRDRTILGLCFELRVHTGMLHPYYI